MRPGTPPSVILIVDDEPAMRLLITMTLDEGYEIREAADGLEALEQIQHQRPNLLVTDWQMPGMDGLALCQRLHADPELCDIPIILLSTGRTDAEFQEAQRAGVKSFVPKPFSPRVLTEQVQELLGRAAT
jgi:CheY-like chemotaxis protein